MVFQHLTVTNLLLGSKSYKYQDNTSKIVRDEKIGFQLNDYYIGMNIFLGIDSSLSLLGEHVSVF